jgi:hypothetical protein
MKRLLFVLLVFAGGCGAGYAFARFDPPQLAYRFEYVPAQRGDQLRCSSPAYAALFATFDKETIDAHAGKGTDTAAIKIDRDAKHVTFLTGAGVRYLGATEGDKYPIVYTTQNTIVAARVEELGAVNALLIRTDTGRVVWTKVSDVLFVSGQATFFECL